MTVDFGEEAAKGFGDAHERFSKNNTGQTLMDLHNNNVGRQLAVSPENNGKDPVKIIKDAIDDGLLILSPIAIPDDGSPDGQPYLQYNESDYLL